MSIRIGKCGFRLLVFELFSALVFAFYLTKVRVSNAAYAAAKKREQEKQ
jgi:hypothetical protein